MNIDSNKFEVIFFQTTIHFDSKRILLIVYFAYQTDNTNISFDFQTDIVTVNFLQY